MGRLGVPYQGSKNAIAREFLFVPNRFAADYQTDLFLGQEARYA